MGCGSSSPKATPAETLIPSQQEFINQVLGEGGMVMSGMEEGFEGYPGQRLAPMGEQYLGYGNQALGNLGGTFDQFTQPYMANFQQNIAPEIMERFASFGGAGSGGAQAAMAKGGAQYMGELAGLYNQNQLALPGLAQQFGGFEQQARQQPIDVAMSKWAEEQPFNNPYLKLGQQFIPTGGQYMENLAEPGQQSFLQSAAPGLAMAPFLMSDERMKEDIEHIDDALDKLELLDGKTFKFRHTKESNGGILAQDLEKILPEAVKEIDGIKYVNYEAVIGLLVNAVKELKHELKGYRI